MSISWTVDRHDTLPSTQDVAQARLKDGVAEGLVVQCDRQVAGRGRFGTVWEGPLGNLYMSLVLRPKPHHQPGHYAFIAALSVVEAFSPYLRQGVTLEVKWPNDVLLDGAKMAGILIEAQWDGANLDGLIMGMGVNVAAPPQGRACVNDGIATPVGVDAARDMILASLGRYIALYDREGFAPIRDGWMRHAWNKGGHIRVRLADRVLQGRFDDLTDQGALRLNLGAEVLDITSGEIVMDGTA